MIFGITSEKLTGIYIFYNRTSCAQVHELPKSQCGDNGDNRAGALFS